MHAVVVNLTINEPDADLRALRETGLCLWYPEPPGSLPATGHGGAARGCQ